jgi:hypothetical protein
MPAAGNVYTERPELTSLSSMEWDSGRLVRQCLRVKACTLHSAGHWAPVPASHKSHTEHGSVLSVRVLGCTHTLQHTVTDGLPIQAQGQGSRCDHLVHHDAKRVHLRAINQPVPYWSDALG